MPKKTDEKKRERAKWSGYVNFRPNDSEAAAIREKIFTPAQFENWLCQCADDGYRVSVKFDYYRGSPVVELYAQWSDMANAGYTLVVAHSDVRVAASAIAFFCEEIAQGGDWPTPSDLRNPYDW